jgi:hypothetical protein
MAGNYVLLETIALTQSAASVTFDNLPTSGYTDLKLVFSIRTDNNSSNYLSAFVTFNGSSSGYSQRMLYGTGSSALSASGSGSYLDWSAYGSTTAATASTFGNGEIYIPNYRSSANKSVSADSVSETNATNAITALTAGLWSNSAAITSITLTGNSGNLLANSTFSLYGIAALGTTPVLAPKATGGNIVANDGTYWYHAFTSSGNFVPQVGLTADCLVIAGGGGGAAGGGGGGAGGLLPFTSQSLSIQNYAVTVGAGGSGAFENKGTNGSNSQFGALTAAVGGGAGGTDYITGLAPESGNSGGSGGGASQNPSAGGTFGVGTVGQGNDGGTGSVSGSGYGGGGGGGAGAAGGNGTFSLPGNGGAGVSTYSSWGVPTLVGQNVSGTYWFAGGGAGGVNSGATRGIGGNGGGGNGGLGTAQPGFAALASTGGGGGGSSGGAAGGTGAAGGSGVVIIRYPIA